MSKDCAGARARWAKVKGAAATKSEPVKKGKRKLSAAHKRKLIKALVKARKTRSAKLNARKTKSKLVKKTDRRSSPEV